MCRHKARYVVFGTNNLRVPDMVALFATSLPAIRAHAGEPGPWVLRIARHGHERLPLRCDDPVAHGPEPRRGAPEARRRWSSRQFLRPFGSRWTAAD